MRTPIARTMAISLVVIAGALPGLPAQAAEVPLVGSDTTWRFDDTGSDNGSAWQASSYGDSTWASGKLTAGYGQGDEVTEMAGNRITYYFRTRFDIASLVGASAVSMNLRIDDGAVVYVNGEEVWRNNVPANQDYSTRATDYVVGAAESAWTTVEVPIDAFTTGRNVFAVEVHNNRPQSSDAIFEMEAALIIGDLNAPSGLTGSAAASEAVNLDWNAVAGATAYDVRRNGTVVGSSKTPEYLDAELDAGTTYSYQVRGRNAYNSGPWSAPITVATPATVGPTVMCRISDPELNEVSGMVMSVLHPGIAWVHNDSGDTARVFALDVDTCQVRATVTLGGLAARDFESISMGRDSAGRPQIWVGDTGDNGASRTNVRLHRILEPTSLDDQTVIPTTVTVTWSDGARDCESLMVEPVPNGRVFLVSKESVGGVYQLRGDFRTTGQATTGTRLYDTLSAATDASIAPDRSRTVIRFYNRARLYSGVPGTNPTTIQLPVQTQGEAITFTPDGNYVYIASEGIGKDLLRVPV